MISFEMFEAFIKDEIWRTKVSELLNSEWDYKGSNLSNTIWADLETTCGWEATDLASEYIFWSASEKEDEAPCIITLSGKDYITTIEILWKYMNEFFEARKEKS